MKLTYLIAIAMISGSCALNKNMTASKNVVTPLSGKTTISEGSLIYGLPLTVVDIEIEAERIIEKPGPYSRYAEDLLGLTDIIKAENEFWTIKGITVNTHQELDPEQFYVIEASTIFQTNVLALKKEGLILDINPDIYCTFREGSLGGETELKTLRAYDLGSDEYFENRKDTVYKIVSVDTAFIKVPYLVEKKQKLTIDQLAEKAAIRLMEMRDGKHLILTGETNLFPQNEAPINEMNRLEKEYTELFTGKTLTERRKFKYQIIPRKDSAGKQITLCMFSESAGPLPSTDKSGTPVIIEFIPEIKTKDLKIIYGKNNSSSSKNYDKLFYRIPDVVNVKVVFGDEVDNTSRKLIYQFGEIIRMPANYIIGK
jgi:hypothetical protein